MLTSIDVNVSSSSIALLSASLEDKWMFSSANILQVAEVVRRVVFLLFLLFLAVSLIVLRKRVKYPAISYCSGKPIQPRNVFQIWSTSTGYKGSS